MSPEEFQRLRTDAPVELGRRLRELHREFWFAVSDEREAFRREEWGGEFKMMLNRNVVVHLVPSFHAQMEEAAHLPQFSIMRAPQEEEGDQIIAFEGVKDLDPFEGVVFYVDAPTYHQLREQLADLSLGYGDFPLIPDGVILDTILHQVLHQRVLEHPLVRQEQRFDRSRLIF